MSQIKIKVLKQGIPSSRVISCVFFTMSSAYKDFSKYAYQLRLMLKNSRVVKGFETRIYTDDTGAEIAVHESEPYSHVSVYHFDCPAFREGKGHTGTFGTLVRFLPLFEEGLETVWISDIDVNYKKGWFSNDLVKLASRYDVFVENRICYERRPWNVGKKYPFVAYRLIFNVTFPKRMLTHYINKLIDGSYSKIIGEINDYNVRKPRNDKFPYGMDEYFTNVVLYDYIKRKNMSCLVHKDYDLSGWFLHGDTQLNQREKDIIQKAVTHETKENIEKAKTVYKKYIPIFISKDPKLSCFKEVEDNLHHFKHELGLWFSVSGKDL